MRLPTAYICSPTMKGLRNEGPRRSFNLPEVTLPGTKCFLMRKARRWPPRPTALSPPWRADAAGDATGSKQQRFLLACRTGWPGDASGGCIRGLSSAWKVGNMEKYVRSEFLGKCLLTFLNAVWFEFSGNQAPD